jgi:tetratricopeptide (TPR) repeat protein
VVFPLVLLLLHFWKAAETPPKALSAALSPRTWLPLWPFFATALLFGLVAVNIQGGGDFFGLLERGSQSVAIAQMDTFSFWQRLQFAGHGFMQYLFKFFWPTGLTPYHPYPDLERFSNNSWYKIAPLLMLAILGLALWSVRTTKALVMGIGFYFITLVLVLQFISVGTVVLAERYSYLPYIGLGMALVFLVQQYLPQAKQRLAYGGLIALSLLLAVPTVRQIEVWQDSETLWTTAIAAQTKDGQPLLNNMAVPLSIRGGFYGKLAQSSTDLQKKQAYLDKAFQDFSQAAKLGSLDANVYKGLGNTYGMRGNSKREQARQLQQQGKAAEAQVLLQQSNQDLQQAIAYHSKVIELTPAKSAESYFNRAITYSILRDHPKAIADYTTFLQSGFPQAGMAYVNRGLSYYELQQYAAAKADFEQALQYNPQDALAKKYLNLIRPQ